MDEQQSPRRKRITTAIDGRLPPEVLAELRERWAARQAAAERAADQAPKD